jgi:6-hydroxymethylpterin diphosphokinase MptE-like
MTGQLERLKNIETNIKSVKKRLYLPWGAHDSTAQLICFGPSLRRTWELIDKTKSIFTVSGAHDFLRGKDVTPNWHIEFDWRPHKARHVTNPDDRTDFFLASCVHPDFIAAVPNPKLWHAQQTASENRLIQELEPEAFLIPGGSSAGLRTIELLYAMGYRTIDIHGMDSSFDDDARWAGPHHGPNKGEVIEVPYAGRKFKTSVAFLMYADQFRACRKAHPDLTINLHGDGLLQTMNTMEMAA